MKKYNGVLVLRRTVDHAHIPEDMMIDVVRRALGDLIDTPEGGSDVTAITGDLIVHVCHIPETDEVEVYVGRLEFTASLSAKDLRSGVEKHGKEAGQVS